MKETKKEDNILKVTIVLAIATYSFWDFISDLGYDIYYIGNALCIFLLAVYIKQISKPSFLTFFLFCVTFNNLLDEILFDNTKFGINEIIATILLILVYFLRKDQNKKNV